MTDLIDGGGGPMSQFPGLTPTRAEPRHRTPHRRSRMGDGFRKTLPFVLASAMTVGLNLTGPVEPVHAAPKKPAKAKAESGSTTRALIAASPRYDDPAAGLRPIDEVVIAACLAEVGQFDGAQNG